MAHRGVTYVRPSRVGRERSYRAKPRVDLDDAPANHIAVRLVCVSPTTARTSTISAFWSRHWAWPARGW